MISPKDFYNELKKNNFVSYVGVPDSLLKSFCAYVQDHSNNHIIASNEGTALAVATGQYLKSKQPSVVYLQNSGIGNLINPLLSLNDQEVYSLPTLILIGWRGEPGVKDEPQHIKQGRVMEDLLKSIEVDYEIMDKDSCYQSIVNSASKFIEKYKKPYVILIKKNTFSEYKLLKNDDGFKNKDFPKREDVLKKLLQLFDKKTLFISTTGVCSRELFEIREALKDSHSNDFLTVGSMGHVSGIAQGICTLEKEKKIVCLDGDGSLIMHLGSLSLNFNVNAKNLIHIVINNSAHDSVGGQPTVADKINFNHLSKAMGFKQYFETKSISEVETKFQNIIKSPGPILWQIFSQKGFRKDLGRPTILPKDNVNDFMNNL
jgi:phosphonopyruvate decarboxylase